MQVVECAKRGISAVGVELNLPLVIYSKYSARRNNVSNYAKFYRRNILKTDLTAYQIAILFGAESMVFFYLHYYNNYSCFQVEMLAPKLDEMNVNSHIIMCRFPMPPNTRWELLEHEGDGIDAAWLYKKTNEIVKRSEISNC